MARPSFLEREDFIETVVFLTIILASHKIAKWIYHLDECVISKAYRWIHGFI